MGKSDLVSGSTSAADALGILELIHGAGVEIWVAGGWGVDALLRSETRDHRDLDILVPYERTIATYETLRRAGFMLVTDWFPVRFEMIDAERSVVDVHPIRRLETGGAELAQLEGPPWVYGPASLAGRGVIAGRRLRCLSPEEQIRSHTGYEPTPTDRSDMERLAEEFALDLPAAYRAT